MYRPESTRFLPVQPSSHRHQRTFGNHLLEGFADRFAQRTNPPYEFQSGKKRSPSEICAEGHSSPKVSICMTLNPSLGHDAKCRHIYRGRELHRTPTFVFRYKTTSLGAPECLRSLRLTSPALSLHFNIFGTPCISTWPFLGPA